jgi:hypothetical protein
MITDNGPTVCKEYQSQFQSSPLTENGFLLRFRRVKGNDTTRYNWTQKHLSWCVTNIPECQSRDWVNIFKWFTEVWPKDQPTLKVLKNSFFANSVTEFASEARGRRL